MVSGLTSSNKVYDATTTASLGGSAQVTALGLDDVTLSGTAAGAFLNKNVGNAKAITVSGLSLAGVDAGNYNIIQQSGLTANITPADLIVSGLTSSNKVYDATTTASLGGSATVTALGLDDVTLSGSAAGAFLNKNVGNAKAITVLGISLAGVNAGNYTIIQQAGLTANITPRPLTVSSFTASDKNFDGTAAAAIGSFTLDNLIAGDDGVVSGLTGTFDSAVSGVNKTVNLNGGVFSGADSLNYAFTLGTAVDFATIFAPPSVPEVSPLATIQNTDLPSTFLSVSQRFDALLNSFDDKELYRFIENYLEFNSQTRTAKRFFENLIEANLILDPPPFKDSGLWVEI